MQGKTTVNSILKRSASAAYPTFAAILLAVLIALTAFIYTRSEGGHLLYDDVPNLSGLSDVKDASSGLVFAFGGDAGPSGRPLALATFLFNTSDWPDNPDGLRLFNIVLHLSNGLLLFFLVYQISGLLRKPPPHRVFVAIACAAIWLAHPYLVSATLSIIQRMALLSTLFVLAGTILYLHGRRRLLEGRPHGLVWMSAGMIAGVSLGVLSKENAVLMPFYLAVLEYGLFTGERSLASERATRIWQRIFLLAPMFAVAAYLAWEVYAYQGGFRMRDFDLSERLASEAVVVPFSIRQIIMPNILVMGPFQDDFPLYSWRAWQPWVGTCFLAGTLVAAFYFRKRAPGFFVAVAGFLAGHLLESTVISLELYFEHRNYLPSMFLIAPTVILLWQYRQRVAVAISLAWFATLALTAYKVTSLWGQPVKAGGAWFAHHPSSFRAAQFLANQHIYFGDLEGAQSVMQRAYNNNPNSTGLALQTIMVTCSNGGDDAEIQPIMTKALPILPKASFDHAASHTLFSLARQARNQACPGLTLDKVDRLFEAVVSNPKYQANRSTRAAMLSFKSERAMERGDRDGGLKLQRQSFEIYPTRENTERLLAILETMGDAEGIRAVLEDPRTGFGSSHPAKRLRWEKAFGMRYGELQRQKG